MGPLCSKANKKVKKEKKDKVVEPEPLFRVN